MSPLSLPERRATAALGCVFYLILVGRTPSIRYFSINALVDEIHRRPISTFLVTNARFPDKIKLLKAGTQLYVSVDAATEDSLKANNRPLFGDFWEQFVSICRADSAAVPITTLDLVSKSVAIEFEVLGLYEWTGCNPKSKKKAERTPDEELQNYRKLSESKTVKTPENL
ncbi:hypothetical protein LguiB_013227 [Lonicera macranthoides]